MAVPFGSKTAPTRVVCASLSKFLCAASQANIILSWRGVAVDHDDQQHSIRLATNEDSFVRLWII
jgi:hypothetical protein